MSTESTDKIGQYYHQFLTDNNITNHETLPILKVKLVTSKTTTTTPTTSTNTDKVHTLNCTKHNAPPPPPNTGPTQAQPEPSSTREQPDQQNIQPTEPTAQRKCKQKQNPPNSKKTTKTTPFFRPKLTTKPSKHLNIHNFSTHNLTNKDLQVLNKGLSFAPTPILFKQTCYLQLLYNFGRYADSLRTQYTKPQNLPTHTQINIGMTPTTTVFQPMKFLPKQSTHPPPRLKPGNPIIENYIHTTKCNLDQQLPNLYKLQKKQEAFNYFF